jgi:hypothetical protein
LQLFIDTAEERRKTIRQSLQSGEKDEQAEPEPPEEPFSIMALVQKSGGDSIQKALCLTWEEFQDLFGIVKRSMTQLGRGRRRSLEKIDRFFILMLYLTSGSKLKNIAVHLGLSISFVLRTVHQTPEVIQAPLKQFFPQTQADIHCETVFENHPEALGIVDASPIFIPNKFVPRRFPRFGLFIFLT